MFTKYSLFLLFFQVCDECGKSFSQKQTLNRHKNIHTREKLHSCEICFKTFGRKDDLNRHTLSHSRKEQLHRCESCPLEFSAKSELIKPIRVERAPQKRKHEESPSSSKGMQKENSGLGVFTVYNFFSG